MLPNQAWSIASNASSETKSFASGRSLARNFFCVGFDFSGCRCQVERLMVLWALEGTDSPAAIALFERGSTLTL